MSTDFVGWFRPHPTAPWRPLVQGTTYAEALDRLLTAVGAGDCLILPAGRDPGPPEPPPRIRQGPGKAARVKCGQSELVRSWRAFLMSERPERPRYRLILEAQADHMPATIRLRRALKHLGHWFGLRVVKVEEVPGAPAGQVEAGPGGRDFAKEMICELDRGPRRSR